jgi:tetratricopeptide (TPR) repeat protein
VRRTIPFVGRTSELAILRESAALAATRGRPVLATILGEPGVGKSRLADELLAGLPEDTAVLIGRDQSIADTTTFAPIAAMVRDLAGGTDPGDSEEHGDPAEADATDTVRISARVREIVDACCDPNEVSLVVERLGLLFGETEGREATSFVQDVQAGFLALIDGLAAQGPVILVFEDVHMLRPPMLDLVERIARGRHRVRGGPAGPGAVLTLAMARPELLDERPAWGTGAANAVRLHLEPLGIDEATSLADQAAGARIDRHAAERIARRTGGNPFFIVETTGMLMGAEGSEEVLPPTVQAVVAARLDALPAPLRELARRASVFLVDFDLPELRVVGAEDLDSIAALEDAEILVRGEEGEGPWWRFRHETLRQVAYASLPKRERRLLHERVADHLEAAGHPTFAADHLEAAAIAAADVDPTDRALPERAAEALAEAGHRARRRMENRTAVDAYRRALAVIGPEAGWGTREARALAGAGEARYWLSDYAGATADLERALELGTALGDDWTLTHALRFLGDIAINVHADLERAEDLLARSLDAAERLGDPRAIARTLLFAGWVPWTRDSYGDAERPWRRALEIAQTEHDRWAEVRALTALSINATNLGDYGEATALIDRGTAVAADMGDAFSEAVTTVQRGRIHEDLGRFDEAIACFDDAIDRFADLGARWELADALAERGICNRETGRLDEAETDLRQAIRLSEELGERQLAGWTWRAYAAVAERRGDTSEAAERARRAAEAASRAPR